MALYRAEKADAERLYRILQRPHARRASERNAVPGGSLMLALPSESGVADYNTRRPIPRSRTKPPAAFAADIATSAERRINRRDSNCCWMKSQWQVTPSRLKVRTKSLVRFGLRC